MLRYSLLLLSLLLCLSITQAKPLQRHIPAAGFSDYLGIRFDKDVTIFRFGSSYRATLWEPKKLEMYGLQGLKRGTRVLVSNVGYGKLRVKVLLWQRPPIFFDSVKVGNKRTFVPAKDHEKPLPVRIRGKILPTPNPKPIRIKRDEGARPLPF